MKPTSLISIRDCIRSRELSSRQAVDRALEQIARLEPQLHALISYDGDRAMDLAEQMDERLARGESAGELAGVPVLVKDNMCMLFGRTTCASREAATASTRIWLPIDLRATFSPPAAEM